MIIGTKFFGQVEVNDDSLFVFESGIPGFSDLHRFIIIKEQNSFFHYLQSVDNENICFIMMDPFQIDPDYDIEISEGTVKKIEIEKPEDVMLYVILTIPENVKNMTANMKAPIVVNTVNRKGIQEVVDDDRYTTRHSLVKEIDA